MSFINPIAFDKDKDDLYNLSMAAKYMRIRQEGGAGLAGWLFDVALRFNAPEQSVLAADKFTAHVEQLALDLKYRDIELCGFAIDDDMFRLKGGGTFANVYKRIDAAMRLGADLTILDTVSALTKFTTKENTRLKTVNEAAMKRAQVESLAKGAGHVEGTPEFDEYVAKAMNSSRPQLVVTDPSAGQQADLDTSVPKDRWAEIGELLAAKLRDLAEVDEDAAVVQANVIEAKLQNMITAAVAHAAKQYASKNLQQSA